MYSYMETEFAEYAHSLQINLGDSGLAKKLYDARWKLMTLLLNYSILKCAEKINIHLFKAKTLDDNHITNGNVPDNGWQQFNSYPINIYPVEGNHNTLIEQPGLNTIAEIINNL